MIAAERRLSQLAVIGVRVHADWILCTQAVVCMCNSAESYVTGALFRFSFIFFFYFNRFDCSMHITLSRSESDVAAIYSREISREMMEVEYCAHMRPLARLENKVINIVAHSSIHLYRSFVLMCAAHICCWSFVCIAHWS